MAMYSGKQIIRAGERLLDKDLKELNPEAYIEAMDVLSYWRFSHEGALDVAFNMLQTVARKKDRATIFAKRLKRYVSIVAKLRRFNKMKLKNMQDIGGCRAIVSNEKKLHQLVRELRKRPEFKSESGIIRAKDYIKNPKEDGYRGYHLIGSFCDGKEEHKSIEIQVRTAMQHSWATALEIVDLFTGQALKSNLGDEQWKNFFVLISEQFYEMESIHHFDTLSYQNKFDAYRTKVINDADLVEKCREMQLSNQALVVRDRFEAFAQSLKFVDKKVSETSFIGYALIEVNMKEKSVKVSLFDDEAVLDAENDYIKLEKVAAESKELVVALVSTTAVGGLKEAFPNYFGDSTNFLKYLLIINNVALPPKPGGYWDKMVKKIFNLKVK